VDGRGGVGRGEAKEAPPSAQWKNGGRTGWPAAGTKACGVEWSSVIHGATFTRIGYATGTTFTHWNQAIQDQGPCLVHSSTGLSRRLVHDGCCGLRHSPLNLKAGFATLAHPRVTGFTIQHRHLPRSPIAAGIGYTTGTTFTHRNQVGQERGFYRVLSEDNGTGVVRMVGASGQSGEVLTWESSNNSKSKTSGWCPMNARQMISPALVLLLSSTCQGLVNGGGAISFGYINKSTVEGDEIGESGLLIGDAFLHGKYLGTALDVTLLTKYNYEIYGRNVSAGCNFLQMKLLLGNRFSMTRGYIYPYVSGGLGFFILTGTDSHPHSFGEIDIEEGGRLTTIGAGTYCVFGQNGIFVEASRLTGDYPPGEASNILIQGGIIFATEVHGKLKNR
jgi:hypothetical protein